MKTVVVKTLDDLDIVLRSIRDCYDKHGPVDIAICPVNKPTRKRTIPQNAALHKYCEIMAGKMNDAGYTQRELVGKFKDGFDLPTTMHMIKDIFRAVGKAMFKKESTADLSTVEMTEVYKVVDCRFGEITGCRAEFPSIESQLYTGLLDKQKG